MPETRPPLLAPSAMPWYVMPAMGLVGEAVFVAGLILSYLLENPTLFNVALGAAISQAQMVVSYFFGSSSGSKLKDDAMVASAIKKEEATTAMAAALATSTPAPTVTTVTNNPGPPPTTTVKTEPADMVPPEPPAPRGP